MEFHLNILLKNIPDSLISIVSTLFSLFQIDATNYSVITKEVAVKEGGLSMIFEVASTILMSAISLKAYQSKNGAGNDSKKSTRFSLLVDLM